MGPAAEGTDQLQRYHQTVNYTMIVGQITFSTQITLALIVQPQFRLHLLLLGFVRHQEERLE